MTLNRLNERDAQIAEHFARKVRAIMRSQIEWREARAAIVLAQIERDNERGNLIREYVRPE